MALTKFGEKTRSVFLKAIEAHTLHQEFEVKAGQATVKGQLLVLDPATGHVLPAGNGAKAFTVIGIALHTRAAGELVTVAMKAKTIVWAQTGAALDAGPVKAVAAAPIDVLYRSYVATADVLGGDVVGYSLDVAAGADEIVRVAIL